MASQVHTTGPWYVSEDKTRVLCGDRDDPNVVVECEVYDIMAVPLDDAPGNARLIAAAPELLQLCRDIVYAWDLAWDDQVTKAVVDTARALLARIERGEKGTP